ncbi:MAG: DUF4835 family protein [Bacteroidota bacterium]|nr:DUF4835 family protein [Bacteroidota bacterium]
MKIISFILLFFVGISSSFSQEIFATVLVESEQIQSQEKQMFEDMKSNIARFINTKKWTNDKFTNVEKIKFKLVIRLTEQPSVGKWRAVAQISVVRPVYGSNYESPLLSFLDKDFNFDYTMSQPIEFNENTYTTNLAALISFYVYFTLGIDYDSFAPSGGTQYLDRAVLIMNNAQQMSVDGGWNISTSNPNNRYALMENMSNPQFKEYREASYLYHRQGLDFLAFRPEEARKKIQSAIDLIKKVYEVKSNSCLLRTFFNTKDDEIVSIFSEATSLEKSKIIEDLKQMDPTNSDKYDKIAK